MSNSNQNKHNQGKPNKHNQGKPNKHGQGKPNQNSKPTSSSVSIEKTPSHVADKSSSLNKTPDAKPYGTGALGGVSHETQVSHETHVSHETQVSQGIQVSPETQSTKAPSDFFPIRKEHEGDLVGRFVQLEGKESDNHYVVYSSGDGQWHLAHGLGKRDCYVIIDENIVRISEKVELAITKLFPNKFTYLTDGNAVYQLVNEEGLYSLRVCGYAKSVTGWHTISESVAFLYQIPHNPYNEAGEPKPTINVFAQSDEALGANVVLNLFKTLNLEANTEVKDVSEIAEHLSDFAAEDFLVKFF